MAAQRPTRSTPATTAEPRLGAEYLENGPTRFRVWAPAVDQVELKLVSPEELRVPMDAQPGGYFQAEVENLPPSARYLYRLHTGRGDPLDRPDPASRLQPAGVHGPSQVVPGEFAWRDECWFGLPLSAYVIYELHVGTFTAAGTFDAVVEHLSSLKALGVTAIELMPVAQFPGSRNWGYDGVYPFAVQHSYGGPAGLKRLVDACHRQGLAVVLDAVHAILDFSARPFLEALARAVHRRAEFLGRRIHLIAESALNDTRIVRPRTLGGFELDAQWNDDFHHCVHTLLTGESDGYYKDYRRGLADLAAAWEEGFVYSGQYSEFRQRAHGNSSRNVPARQLVVCSQNHDQVGNRMLGERIGALVSFEQQKLAAALVLLSPFIPLIFMGEEYGETAPFLYFVSHGDPDLVQAVREGRKREFAAFQWTQEPPDPQDEQTFQRSQLNHDLRREGRHRVLSRFYRELLRLRSGLAPLANLSKKSMSVLPDSSQNLLQVRRRHRGAEVCLLFNFNSEPAPLCIRLPAGDWRRRIDSGQTRWEGPGSSVPERLHAAGPVELTPAPSSVVVLSGRNSR